MSRVIGLVGPYPPYRGGISHFTDRLHTHLEKSGCRVVPVSFKRQYPAFLFPGKSQKTDIISGSVQAAPLIDSIGPASWPRAAHRLIHEGVEEVIFMHWMPFFAPAYVRMAGMLKRKGIRVTAIVHNAIPHERQPFGKSLNRWFLSRCDRLIALSESVKRDVRTLTSDAEVQVLPHPTYDQFGAPMDPTESRVALGIGKDENVVLFFGLVRHYKGLDVLAEALPSMQSCCRLVVAGEWYEKGDELKQVLAKNAPDAIIHDRYIADSEVARYFSAADLVVQPYRTATQSGVVQTAFHFGKPVIVTGVGGLPEMVRHEEDALIVAPSDERALARAMDAFFEPERRARLTEGAIRAGERFTWEAFTERLLAG